ncbi:MAG: hypothetical protein QM726_19985 [Chitinophagaceae bacterium]
MRRILSILFLLSFVNYIIAQNKSVNKTYKVNAHKFHIFTKSLDDNYILLKCTYNSKSILSDTVDGGGLFSIKLPDFDTDGYPDIMLTYLGNNDTYYLYLFDKANKRFKKVLNFENYPHATQLKTNRKYYYSYHRAGCADLDWMSDLFEIVDFKAIRIGHIYGLGCDFDVKNNPQVIKIYRVTDSNITEEHLIATLSYQKFIPNFGDKWGFIKKYWNKNYKGFR